MSTKAVWGSGLTMALLISGGCSSSTTGARDGAAGDDGPMQDRGAGGQDATDGSGSGGLGAGGVGTGGVGSGGVATGAGGISTGGRDGGVGAGGITGGTDASIAGAGGRDAAGGSGVDGGRGGAGGGGGATVDGSVGIDGGCAASGTEPAVARGGQYFGFSERLNRHYTDCAWQPSSTVYVSPNGTGNGSSRSTPASAATALAAVVPGRMVVFTAGTYAGCFALDSDHGGSYDSPVVLLGERKADGSPAVTINCCTSGRKTCINLEASDYVAVDGFELVGGDYGVRAVGAGYPANQHQKGIAVLNNIGHGQNKDPFFTGQSDWLVIENCTAHDSGSGDGHGIYLSNGSDWNIARYNETYNTASSDFQINADPGSTCTDDGVDVADPECDAVAGSSPTGGRGASDFMLIEANFFHHSLAQGPNFTSVRNSTIKNNIFALPARHVASFWQETENPKLGSSNNLIAHNLFITQVANRQAIGVTNSSTGNQFKNNVVMAVSVSGSTVAANANGELLTTDATTVKANTFEHNAWVSGYIGSDDTSPAYTPTATERVITSVDPTWFAAFPTSVGHDPAAFGPTATTPWLDSGNLLPEVPTDRAGVTRHAPVDLGPFER